MTRVTNGDIQAAIEWLDTYEMTDSEPDEFGNSLARMKTWLGRAMQNRAENAAVAKIAARKRVPKSMVRKALRISEQRKSSSS